MRRNKILALMKRDLTIFRRSKWRFAEFVYFPITTVIIWGLFAVFSRNFSAEAGLMVLAVNVFWSFSVLSQTTINLQINEDFWSGSFVQVISTGITEFEYIAARVFTASMLAAVIMFLMLLTSLWFGLTIIVVKQAEIFLLSILTLFGSIALSFMVAGLILFFGREYAFLAWTALQLFVLLSAPFYPLDILPEALRYTALVMPFTNIFMGVRELIGTGSISSYIYLNSFIIIIGYLMVSIPLYYYAFKRARRNGMLARLF